MSYSQEIRTGRHCVFNMHVHLVFVAKYRRDVFTKAMLETMREVFERVCSVSYTHLTLPTNREV